MLSSPHEAAPPFHEDWTIIDGSSHDPVKWELELRLRGVRNRLIREDLEAGLAVFYRSTGSSMWPLVQSHDACTFHPIQAVTADVTDESIECCHNACFGTADPEPAESRWTHVLPNMHARHVAAIVHAAAAAATSQLGSSGGFSCA